MNAAEDMVRVWRRFAFMLAAAVLAGSVLIAAALLGALAWQHSRDQEVETLREQVAQNDAETLCRSRIAAAATQVDRQGNSLLRQSLLELYSDNSAEGRARLSGRAQQMADLNRKTAELTDLQTRSVEICAENAAFVPPI